MSVSRPMALGGTIAVPNSGQLAIMPATGLPIGTRVWNDGVGSFFTLRLSTAALDPDVVVAVADTVGSRWLLDTLIATDAGLIAAYRTITVNLLVAASTDIDMPLVPGKRFIPIQGKIAIDTRTGAADGSGFVYDVRQNGVSLLSAGISSSAAVINGVAAPQVISNFFPGSAGYADMTTFPLQFNIITPITGSTVASGHFELVGFYR